MTTNKFFNATKGKNTGDSFYKNYNDTQLLKFIESYVSAIFPENGMEYWSNGKFAEDKDKALPLPGFEGDKRLHHVACYVASGNCEGEIIRINLMLSDGSHQFIGSAKSFNGSEVNWEIAKSITKAIESMYFYNETPLIADFYDVLPRARYGAYPIANYNFDIHVLSNSSSVKVIVDPESSQIEKTLYECDFSDAGDNSEYLVSLVVKDWLTVLNNYHFKIKELPLVSQEDEQESSRDVNFS